MGNEYPETIFRVLELAESQTATADVPLELRNALEFCLLKLFVRIEPCTLVGYTETKSIGKTAHELRPGDVIRWDAEHGIKIHSVEVDGEIVNLKNEFIGAAVPRLFDQRMEHDRDVVVFDGPLPQPIYSAERLVLNSEGRAKLALHRVMATAGVALTKEGGGIAWSIARSPSDWLQIFERLNVDCRSISVFGRRRADGTYRQHPDSTTKSVKLALEDLPPSYSDEMTI